MELKKNNEEVSLEKIGRLEEIRRDVNRTVNGLGMPIDKGIRETIVFLWALGFKTSGSCEGHLDRGLPHPWVDFSVAELFGFRLPYDMNEEERKEYRNKNLEQINRLQKLLDEFYSKRNVEEGFKLCLYEWTYGDFRLQSKETIEKDREIISEKLDAEPLKKNLERYRKEMKAFTNFLKKKYFSE